MVSSESSQLSPQSEAVRPQTRPIDVLLKPLQAFGQHKLAGGGLLLAATIGALAWANSPWAPSYHHLLHLHVGIHIGGIGLVKTVHHWINDGLMGVFFFMVGLEIKRELMAGQLATVRKATLPAIAAVGGMLVPALIYFALNPSGSASRGWGVPMATDIAFALGVLALLGARVPLGLKVFLTALAIVDDIGAVLVVALFYTAELSVIGLVAGLVCLAVSITLNSLGARNPVVYFIVGTLAWLGFLESGVHATIAAILMAFTIPARTCIDGEGLAERIELLMTRLRTVGLPRDTAMNDPEQQRILDKMNETIDSAAAPLQSIEHALVGPVTFLVLPIFALANAGVSLHANLNEVALSPVVFGIVAGLFVGKLVGVFGSSWLAVRFKLADLPAGVTWPQLAGVAVLAGIGFTMALFVSALAFTDPNLQESAKIGILAASALSGVVGISILYYATRPKRRA